jgi:hypothetical protein
MKGFYLLILLLVSNLGFSQIPVFPGAEGFGANQITAGRGGQIIYVTNLECAGVGSLNYALSQTGPRTIIFKVSGIIDCPAEIVRGNVYVAGQTSPGGIIIRGLLMDGFYEAGNTPNNVLVRYIRSRPHTKEFRPYKTSWMLDDALRIDGAHGVMIDHCSFANATDECVQISRSSGITIQNSMFSETIGSHFDLGGMLLNYSTAEHPKDSISIHHNIWNRLGGRMPEISCERSSEKESDLTCIRRPMNFEYSNNLLWDIPISIYYNAGFDPSGQITADSFFMKANFVNNMAIARSSYGGAMFQHNLLEFANQFYVNGNKMNLYPNYSDYELFYCCNDFNEEQNRPNTDLGLAAKNTSRFSFPSINYTATNSLQAELVKSAGAFPRDIMDKRLINPIKNGNILSTLVNETDHFEDAFLMGHDTLNPPPYPLDSDDDGMPNEWENKKGINPNSSNNNGTELSLSVMGLNGYTNLECYLYELGKKLDTLTQLPTSITEIENQNIFMYPNPANDKLFFSKNYAELDQVNFYDLNGKLMHHIEKSELENNHEIVNKGNRTAHLYNLDISFLPKGFYFVQIGENFKKLLMQGQEQ